MAIKSLLFVFLVLASIAYPMANAQGGTGLVGFLLGLINVQGIVPCSVNLGLNGTTSIFPNAEVKLNCGGKVVASTTTNGAGAFSILLDPLQFVLSTVLSSCNLAVTTPLSSCNATLPSVGSLISPLQPTGDTVVGLLKIINIIPAGFKFLSST